MSVRPSVRALRARLTLDRLEARDVPTSGLTVEHPFTGATLVRYDDGLADVRVIGDQYGSTLDVHLSHADGNRTYPFSVTFTTIGSTSPYTFSGSLAADGTSAVTQQYGTFSITVGNLGGVATLDVFDAGDDTRVRFEADVSGNDTPDAFDLTMTDGNDIYQTTVGGFTEWVDPNVDGHPVTASVAADGSDLVVRFDEIGSTLGFDLRVGAGWEQGGESVSIYFRDGLPRDVGDELVETLAAEGNLVLASGDGRIQVTLTPGVNGALGVQATDFDNGASLSLTVTPVSGGADVSLTTENSNGATRSVTGTVAAGSNAPTTAFTSFTVTASSDGSLTESVGLPASDGTATVTLDFQSGTTTSFTTTVGWTGTPLPVTDNATFQHTEQFSDGATLTVSLFAANADGTVPAVMVITNDAVAFGMNINLQSQEASNLMSSGVNDRLQQEYDMLAAKLAKINEALAGRLRHLGNLQDKFDEASKRGDRAARDVYEEQLALNRKIISGLEAERKEIIIRMAKLRRLMDYGNSW